MVAAKSKLRPLAAIGAFAGLYLLATFLVDNSYYQLMMTLVLIWATFGLSWNMLSGYSGLISFGHASFFGLGAYTVAIAYVDFGITPWVGILIGVAVGAVAGLLIGYPTFRLRGHYFALAMLAYPLALLYLFEWANYQEVPFPIKRVERGENPVYFMQFDDQRVYAILALILLVAALLVSLWVERARFGRSLLAIKQNELAAEAAGIDTLRWKLRAILVSGAMAAAAGGLYAVVLLLVTPPTVFGLLVSAQALIVVLFGGVGTLWGAVIGASILIPLAETLHAELGHIIPGIQGVVYGMAIILVLLLAPDGIYWKIRDRLQRAPAAPRPGEVAPEPQFVGAAVAAGASASPGPARAAGPPVPAGSGATVMELQDVSKRFGGLRAVDRVSFTVEQGMIVGIIGPNGAGKTTLFNVINGFLSADGGEIRFQSQDLVGLKPNRVCRLGIGRTFQVVRPFPRMTVLENVIVGSYVGASDDEEAEAMAMEALARVGLANRAGTLASGLTSKDLRLMELARALAPRPTLLLMDETLAGLGRQEIEELLNLVRGLKQDGITVVIIEHTMQAMVRLADRFIVLDHGAIIASGPPDQVVDDPQVIEAYLGRKWAERARS